MDGERMVDKTDLSQMIAKSDPGDGAGSRRNSVIRTWVTWHQPVEAGCFTDLNALDTICAWVDQLHTQSLIKPGLRFTIEEDDGEPVGVLHDPDETLARWAVLRRDRFLVRTGDKLEVLDPDTFHSRYCDIAYVYSQGGRRAG